MDGVFSTASDIEMVGQLMRGAGGPLVALSDLALQLAESMGRAKAGRRPTAEKALQHPWFAG